MDDRELGRRIAYWRQRRDMTQKLFADRIGRSKSWVEKVERGDRSADRLSILDSICETLQIDLTVLIGQELRRGTQLCIDNDEVERIRAVLESYPPGPHGATKPAEPALLRRRLHHAWMAFELADYAVISRVLPALVEDGQHAHTAHMTAETAQMLTEVYQIAASTLRKLGEYSLAWLAGDRGYRVAEQFGELTAIAATGFRIANALLSMGRARSAVKLHTAMATRLQPRLAPEGHRALYGHVLLQAAVAAAAAEDEQDVDSLLAEAADIARHITSGSNHFHLEFGAANVALHKVGVMVALGEGGRAVEAAQEIDRASLATLRAERRAALLVDVARGHSQVGRRDSALRALLQAEQIASREVQCRPVAQSTIADLLRRHRGTLSVELSRLAQRAGVTA